MYRHRLKIETEGREPVYTCFTNTTSLLSANNLDDVKTQIMPDGINSLWINLDSDIKRVLFLNRYQLDRTIFTVEEEFVK